MNKDTKTLYKVCAATGFILDKIEELENGSFWFRKIKQTGNRFLKELKVYEDTVVNGADEDAVQQLVDSYSMFNDLIDLSFVIQEKKKKSFERELSSLIEKYNKGI